MFERWRAGQPTTQAGRWSCWQTALPMPPRLTADCASGCKRNLGVAAPGPVHASALPPGRRASLSHPELAVQQRLS
jgi:hypothetical protein